MIEDKVAADRERVRLWFEFYKIALATESCRDALRNSDARAVFKGVTARTQFDRWWKKHKCGFGALGIQVIPALDNDAFYDATLYLAVPLSLTESELVKQFRSLIRGEKRARPNLSKSVRSLRSMTNRGEVPVGAIHLPAGTQLRVEPANISLLLYRQFWHGRSRPKVNVEFYRRVKAYLQSIGCQLPKGLNHDIEGARQDTALRNLDRFLTRGEQLVRSAAMGIFPKPPGKQRKLQRGP